MASSNKKYSPDFCEMPGCQGFEHYVQRHRIVPGRDGGRYRLGNVISLCPNHHAMADAGELSPEELLHIVADRLLKDQTDETNDAR